MYSCAAGNTTKYGTINAATAARITEPPNPTGPYNPEMCPAVTARPAASSPPMTSATPATHLPTRGAQGCALRNPTPAAAKPIAMAVPITSTGNQRAGSSTQMHTNNNTATSTSSPPMIGCLVAVDEVTARS